jgi:hypothetical protein
VFDLKAVLKNPGFEVSESTAELCLKLWRHSVRL